MFTKLYYLLVFADLSFGNQNYEKLQSNLIHSPFNDQRLEEFPRNIQSQIEQIFQNRESRKLQTIVNCRKDCIDNGNKYCMSRQDLFKQSSRSGTCCSELKQGGGRFSVISRCSESLQTSADMVCSLPYLPSLEYDEGLSAINYAICPQGDYSSICGPQIIPISHKTSGHLSEYVITEFGLKSSFPTDENSQNFACTYVIKIPQQNVTIGDKFLLQVTEMNGVEVFLNQIKPNEERIVNEIKQDWIQQLNLLDYNHIKVQNSSTNYTITNENSGLIPMFLTVWPNNQSNSTTFKVKITYFFNQNLVEQYTQNIVLPPFFFYGHKSIYSHLLNNTVTSLGKDNIFIIFIIGVAILVVFFLTFLTVCYFKNKKKEQKINKKQNSSQKKSNNKNQFEIKKSIGKSDMNLDDVEIEFQEIGQDSQRDFTQKTFGAQTFPKVTNPFYDSKLNQNDQIVEIQLEEKEIPRKSKIQDKSEKKRKSKIKASKEYLEQE